MEQTTGNLSDIVLQCNDISKEFDSFDNSGKNQVLSHIDLSVKKNEFLVLFGPGQCGKTTLLNILAGVLQAAEGCFYVDDEKVEGISSHFGWFGTSHLRNRIRPPETSNSARPPARCGLSTYCPLSMADGHGKCGIWSKNAWHG